MNDRKHLLAFLFAVSSTAIAIATVGDFSELVTFVVIVSIGIVVALVIKITLRRILKWTN